MKIDQKNLIYPSVKVSCMSEHVNIAIQVKQVNAEQDKALTWAIYELGI